MIHTYTAIGKSGLLHIFDQLVQLLAYGLNGRLGTNFSHLVQCNATPGFLYSVVLCKNGDDI